MLPQPPYPLNEHVNWWIMGWSSVNACCHKLSGIDMNVVAMAFLSLISVRTHGRLARHVHSRKRVNTFSHLSPSENPREQVNY